MVNVQVGACSGGKKCTELGARLVSRSSVGQVVCPFRNNIILHTCAVVVGIKSTEIPE